MATSKPLPTVALLTVTTVPNGFPTASLSAPAHGFTVRNTSTATSTITTGRITATAGNTRITVTDRVTGGMGPPNTSTETNGAMATATREDTANTNLFGTRKRS